MGRFHIMLHVPDKCGFMGMQPMLGQQGMNVGILMADARMNGFKIFHHAQLPALGIKLLGVHAGKNKAAHAARAAELQEFPGIRQHFHRSIGNAEGVPEMVFQFIQIRVGEHPGIIVRIGKLEFRAKFIPVHAGFPVLGKDVVGGVQRQGQVVHQGARPVENDIFKHGNAYEKTQSRAYRMAARPKKAAVSTRRTIGPSVTGTNPASNAMAVSRSVKSPSGPTSREA